jgi:hypothetical protein
MSMNRALNIYIKRYLFAASTTPFKAKGFDKVNGAGMVYF